MKILLDIKELLIPSHNSPFYYTVNNKHFTSQYQLVDWKFFSMKNLLSFISVSYLLFIFINKLSRLWTRKTTNQCLHLYLQLSWIFLYTFFPFRLNKMEYIKWKIWHKNNDRMSEACTSFICKWMGFLWEI